MTAPSGGSRGRSSILCSRLTQAFATCLQAPSSSYQAYSVLWRFSSLTLAALEIPEDRTQCNRTYTYIRPTAAERNSTLGFIWFASYYNSTDATENLDLLLVSKYFSWMGGSPVYGPYNRTFGTANASSDPSYLLDYNLRSLWNSNWHEPPTYAGQAYITVRLVTNYTFEPKPSGGRVRVVSTLKGSDDGTVIATPYMYKRSWISRSTALFAVLLALPGILILLWVAYQCCTPWAKKKYHASDRQHFLNRRWRTWRSARAAERMEQPTYIDDTEKLDQAPYLDPNAEPLNAVTTTTTRVANTTPTMVSLARRASLPAPTTTSATLNPDHIVAWSGTGDTMDGHPKPLPAYVAPQVSYK